MTTRAVGTVICCADQIGGVYDTIETIARQSSGAGPTAIVTDATTSPAAMDWLRAFARSRGAVLVESDSDSPGAARNAGIAALDAEFVMCVDAGDRLDPQTHEAVLAAFNDDPPPGIVTPAVQLIGPGSERRVVAAARTDLEALVCNTEAIASSSAFSVATWRALGGF